MLLVDILINLRPDSDVIAVGGAYCVPLLAATRARRTHAHIDTHRCKQTYKHAHEVAS